MKGCRWMTYHLTVHEVCVSKKTNRLTAMYLTRYIVVGGWGREGERVRGRARGDGEGGRERGEGGRERENPALHNKYSE